jgi:uncharacterized ion transporter superfamily protein YfcC
MSFGSFKIFLTSFRHLPLIFAFYCYFIFFYFYGAKVKIEEKKPNKYKKNQRKIKRTSKYIEAEDFGLELYLFLWGTI